MKQLCNVRKYKGNGITGSSWRFLATDYEPIRGIRCNVGCLGWYWMLVKARFIQTWHTGWNTEVTTKGLHMSTNYKYKQILHSWVRCVIIQTFMSRSSCFSTLVVEGLIHTSDSNQLNRFTNTIHLDSLTDSFRGLFSASVWVNRFVKNSSTNLLRSSSERVLLVNWQQNR